VLEEGSSLGMALMAPNIAISRNTLLGHALSLRRHRGCFNVAPWHWEGLVDGTAVDSPILGFDALLAPQIYHMSKLIIACEPCYQ
jgi:hypothetical protein